MTLIFFISQTKYVHSHGQVLKPVTHANFPEPKERDSSRSFVILSDISCFVLYLMLLMYIQTRKSRNQSRTRILSMPKERLHESRPFFFEVYFCSRTCTYAGAEASLAGIFSENKSRGSMEVVRDFLERRINVITRRTSQDMRQSVEASSKKLYIYVNECV